MSFLFRSGMTLPRTSAPADAGMMLWVALWPSVTPVSQRAHLPGGSDDVDYDPESLHDAKVVMDDLNLGG